MITVPTFITLINFTEDGIDTLADLDSDEFLVETRDTVQAHGGELKDYYFALGQYDAIGITEFPDAESATKALLTALQEGGVKTETLRAFTEDETRELIGAI